MMTKAQTQIPLFLKGQRLMIKNCQIQQNLYPQQPILCGMELY